MNQKRVDEVVILRKRNPVLERENERLRERIAELERIEREHQTCQVMAQFLEETGRVRPKFGEKSGV